MLLDELPSLAGCAGRLAKATRGLEHVREPSGICHSAISDGGATRGGNRVHGILVRPSCLSIRRVHAHHLMHTANPVLTKPLLAWR